MNIGQGAELNLINLIDTRLLIQANSSGGKSWLLRRILEQTHGKVQQLVIDLEGEFASLRDNYDYLLVGREGEIPANIKTADLLAKKLLELNVSTIIDLSELKHYERKIFVKRFLDSMINSPKNLWHPVLIIVDEAHQFVDNPQKDYSKEEIAEMTGYSSGSGVNNAISKLCTLGLIQRNNGRLKFNPELFEM